MFWAGHRNRQQTGSDRTEIEQAGQQFKRIVYGNTASCRLLSSPNVVTSKSNANACLTRKPIRPCSRWRLFGKPRKQARDRTNRSNGMRRFAGRFVSQGGQATREKVRRRTFDRGFDRLEKETTQRQRASRKIGRVHRTGVETTECCSCVFEF